MRYWTIDEAGCKMLQDAGCGMQDAGCRMRDAGCRMQDASGFKKPALKIHQVQLLCGACYSGIQPAQKLGIQHLI